MIDLLLILALLCGMTCLLEIIPALFMREKKKWIKASLVSNVITNPILNTLLLLYVPMFSYSWFIARLLSILPFSYEVIRNGVLLMLELGVVGFEAWIYRKMAGASWKKCLIFSLAANTVTFAIGLLLEPIFTMPLDWEIYKWLVLR